MGKSVPVYLWIVEKGDYTSIYLINIFRVGILDYITVV
jgi:hypothetical protein